MKVPDEGTMKQGLIEDTKAHLVKNKKALGLLAIFLLSLFFFFFNLGSYSLKEPDEGRYAEIPREMVEQGDYMVPRLDYVRYFEKPPLHYWMTALSFRISGANEWSFRPPNALVALLCVVVTYLFTARWFSVKTGLLAALILMSCFSFIALAHIVTIDMLFSSLLFISLLSFLGFYREKRALFLYLFSITWALAVLAKGPVAIILMGVTIVLFLITEKRISFLKEMASIKGILLFVLIAAPWFVAVSIMEKEFFHFFFIDQHILRFLTKKHKRSRPIYYFVPVLLGGLFPWSVFLPRALDSLWRRRDLRLLLIWSAVVFAFFSVSGSKLPPYILPVFPALCVVLAAFFEENWHHVAQGWETIVYGVFFFLIMCAGLACGSGLIYPYLAAKPDIASVLHGVRGFSWALAGISFIAALSLVVKRMRTVSSLFSLLVGFSLFVTIALMLHAHVADELNTTKGQAGTVSREARADALVVSYGTFDETLPFYLKKRTHIAAYTGELAMGAGYEDAKQYFISEDELARLFRSDREVWVLFREKRLERLRGLGIGKEVAPVCRDNRCLAVNAGPGR